MTPMQPMQPMDQRMQQLQQMQQMGQQMQQMSPQVGMNQGGVAPSPRPMEPMAQQMAQQGRYGDSMLVHMNPVEVAGIASLSPTGSLTTNPMTGQPEAFLPFLAPILGSMFGSTVLGAAGSALGTGAIGSALTAAAGNTALAGAIGSGLATTAVTGDIKKGLMSGLTGYGIGSALGAAKDLANPAIADTAGALAKASETATTTGIDLAQATADAASPIAEAATGVIDPLTGQMQSQAFSAVPQIDALSGATMNPAMSGLQQSVADTGYQAAIDANSAATANVGRLSDNLAELRGDVGLRDIANPTGIKNFGKALLRPSSLLPIGVGEGQRAAMEAQEARDAQFGATEADRKRRLDEAQGLLDQSLGQVATDYGYDYGRSYQAGGITSVDPSDYQRRMVDFQQMGMQQPVRMDEGGSTDEELAATRARIAQNSFGSGGRGFGFNPAARQASLRGPVTITPQELEGYRPGIDPEISYFRQPLDGEGTAQASVGNSGPPPPPADLTTDAELANFLSNNDIVGGEGGGTSGVGIYGQSSVTQPNMAALSGQTTPDLYSGIGAFNTGASSSVPAEVQEAQEIVGRESVSQRKRQLAQEVIDDYEAGGRGGQDYFNQTMNDIYNIGGMYAGGTVMMAKGDKVPAGDPAQALIQQTAMALLGRMSEEESSVVIKRFVDEFGSEAFQQLRSQVLESVVPNSQKEGLIQGAGGGMDDQIGGMIGDQQKVAVSPGEFIVPGDVVSGLGDGDTGAGAKELAAMMDRVRTERTGTTEQPEPLVNVRGGGILPA